MEGSHSLWGVIWSIQKETGWTHNYLLWGESWLNIQMKIADSPKTIDSSPKKQIDDVNEIMDLFD